MDKAGTNRWTAVLQERGDVLPARMRMPLIAVFEGEGIGAEVIRATLDVLGAIEESERFRFEVRHGGPIGTAAEESCGKPLSDDALSRCREVAQVGGAVLAGPGGGRFVYDLRRELDLFCKISPVTPYPELRNAGAIRPEKLDGVDLLFVRENVSGVYQGTWSEGVGSGGEFVAAHQFSYSRKEVERIIRVAACIARDRDGRLTVLHKAGGIPSISALWATTAREISDEIGIQHAMMNVDYAAYLIVHDPKRLDVVVTPNLMGDIVIDLAGALVGSRGLTFSGNFDANGFGVYQTNHGAAHDLAGMDRANPCGQIFSLAMLLRESFGLFAAAGLIEASTRDVWRRGWRTADVMEPGCRVVGTREMGALVSEAVLQSAGKLAAR